MSGYLQRLMDRAAAASPLPPVLVAGRMSAPLAEADQRLLEPGIDPTALTLNPFRLDAAQDFDDQTFDDPRQEAATPPPAVRPDRASPAPLSEPSRAATTLFDTPPDPPPSPRAPQQSAEPAPVSQPPVSGPNAIAPSPVETDREGIAPLPAPEPAGQAPLVEPKQYQPTPPETNARATPVDAPQTQSHPALIEPEYTDAAPAIDLPAPLDIPAPAPTPETRSEPPAKPHAELPLAEPRIKAPPIEAMPEPDIAPMAEPAAAEAPAPYETVVERTAPADAGEAQNKPTASESSTKPTPTPNAPAHVTAASASIIGPLPDHQRTPMLRGRRRR